MQFILSCPKFETAEDTLRAKTLCLMSTSVFIASIIALLMVLLVIDEKTQGVYILLIIMGAALGTRWMLHANRLLTATTLLPGTLWLSITLTIFSRSGISHPAVTSYIVVIVIVALLVNRNAAILASVATLAATLAAAIVQEYDLITFTAASLTPLSSWLIFGLNVILTTVIVHLVLHTINEALNRATTNEQMLRTQNQRLEDEIGDRQDIETALRSERDLLSHLTDHSPVGIARFDANGNVVYANPHIRDQLAIQEGSSVYDVDYFDYDGRPMPQEAIPFERVKASNEQVRDTYVAFQINDNLRYFSITAAPLFDRTGEFEGVISIQQDVTERVDATKQAEHFSELQSLISHISTRFINISLEEVDETVQLMLGTIGAFLGVDRCFVLLLNNSHTAFQLQHEWVAPDVKAIKPSYKPIKGQDCYWIIDQLASRDILEVHGDQQHHLRDLAGIGDGSMILLPLNQSGQIIGGVGFDSVAFDRQWKEDEIILLKIISQIITNAYDRRRIEEQSVELARVQDRVRLLQEFISNISHDIKTPLTAISSNIYLLKHVEEEDRRERYFKTIEDQIMQLDRLIQDILTISRLEAAPTINARPVDINQLIRVILSRLESAFERKQTNLKIDLDSERPYLLGDVNELDRALTHIVQNSVNYTHVEGHISISTKRSQNEIHIEVTDDGIGITEEDQPRVFDRFFRADPARNTNTGGTGLGLSISKRVIELHNGEIYVDSVPDQGSTFTIVLPAMPDSS